MLTAHLKKELDPLYQVWDSTIMNDFCRRRQRMLTDRGILEMLKTDLVKFTPELKPEEIHSRIQPTSIDVRMTGIDCLEALSRREKYQIRYDDGQLLVPSNYNAECTLLDNIWVECITTNTKNHTLGSASHMPFRLETVARSSVVRSGLFESYQTPFLVGPEMGMKLTNLSVNDVQFEKNEAIGQVFIKPEPFFDQYGQVFDDEKEIINTDTGDFVRSLDMGVEIRTEESLRYLSKEGYFSLPREGDKEYVVKEGFIVLHAKSTANRMRKLGTPLEFSKRKEYQKSDVLYEDIDISKGYTVGENEVIVVDTQESLELSPNIGMMLYEQVRWGNNVNPAYDNVVNKILNRNSHIGPAYLDSLHSANITWADPGYKGIMTGLPKLPGVTIKTGDPIGLMRVFYYPNGVAVPYGDPRRNSQYQGQKTFQVGATK